MPTTHSIFLLDSSTHTLSLSASESLLSMNSRDYDYDPRAVSVFGRYWFADNWAVSAESLSREPTGLLRLQDFRIGVQRRF